MLKEVAVSRQGPRSMATTSSPWSVSSLPRIAPVHPRPMITTSFFGSFVAIGKNLNDQNLPGARDRPIAAPQDRYGRQRVGLIVFADVVAIVVTRARKADELPSRHVTVAAIDRIGEEAFHRVGQDGLEEVLAAAVLELDVAGLKAIQHLILLRGIERRKAFAGERRLAVFVERRERDAIALLGQDRRLKAL